MFVCIVCVLGGCVCVWVVVHTVGPCVCGLCGGVHDVCVCVWGVYV